MAKCLNCGHVSGPDRAYTRRFVSPAFCPECTRAVDDPKKKVLIKHNATNLAVTMDQALTISDLLTDLLEKLWQLKKGEELTIAIKPENYETSSVLLSRFMRGLFTSDELIIEGSGSQTRLIVRRQ